MLRCADEEITYLCIDEKSSERIHTFTRIPTGIDSSWALDLVPERKLMAAVSLLEKLTPPHRIWVKAVVMDVWPA